MSDTWTETTNYTRLSSALADIAHAEIFICFWGFCDTFLFLLCFHYNIAVANPLEYPNSRNRGTSVCTSISPFSLLAQPEGEKPERGWGR